MAGITDIFTGDKPEGTPGQVIDTTPDEYAGLRSPISSALSGAITGSGTLNLNGIPTSGNARAAQLTPTEQALLDRIGGINRTGTTNAAFTNVNDTIAGKYLTPGSNPFLQASIDAAVRPITEAYQRTTVPNLQQKFTASGQMVQPGGSSPFDKALAQAQSDYLNTIADTSTKIAAGNYEQERSRQQEAVNQSAGLQQAEIGNLVSQLQAEALPRLVEQLGIDKGLAEFNTRMNVLLQVLGLSGNLSAGNTAVIPGTAPPAQEGFGSLLSGAGALLKGYGYLTNGGQT